MKAKVWISMSRKVHEKIKSNYKEEGFATMTQYILHVLEIFHPAVLHRDRSFITKDKKMSMMRLGKSEIKMLSDLAEKYQMKRTAMVRNILYTYLFPSPDGQ